MPEIGKILSRSGPCLDSLALLRLHLYALDNGLLRPLAIALRIKFTPDILEKICAAPLALEEKSALFSRALTLFRSGPSYKTTAAGRTRLTDLAILGKLREGAVILETGVSDGISAAGLLENARGARVILSDSQDCFRYRELGPLRLFYDKEDRCLSLKLPLFYLCTGLEAGKPPENARRIPLANPLLREKFGISEIVPFDIFSGILPRKADVIKCSNVLNGVYFPPEEAKRAIANLSRSLAKGGWLFISQNHEKYAAGEAYVALQEAEGGLALREEANGHELLPHLKSALFSDLVRAAPEGRPANR